MGRRRVLVLAPAITRMQCMSNPYKRVNDKANSSAPDESGARRSFWSSWRKKKKAIKVGGSTGSRRKWGFRVIKLRIRVLSPLFWLKRIRDSYLNMMLAIEENAAGDCSRMVSDAAYVHRYQGAGGVHWVWPTLAPPVVF